MVQSPFFTERQALLPIRAPFFTRAVPIADFSQFIAWLGS
jgi:hypothetical protein